jgi:hypothetical protein
VSLQASVVITEQYKVMVNSEEVIATTEYLTLYTRCRIKRGRYNLIVLYTRIVYSRAKKKLFKLKIMSRDD